MTEAQFIAHNQARWQDYETLLRQRPGKRFAHIQTTWTFPRAYRQLCRDLNYAKAERYSLDLIDTLNRQVWAGHQILYRSRTASPLKSILTFSSEFPAQLRHFWRALVLCHLLFYGIVGLAFLYGHHNISHIEAFLGSEVMDNLQQMYNPASEHALRPNGVESDVDMFGFYIANNIGIGFRTFAGGVLAGVGSLIMLVYNALFMGAVMAFIDTSGFNPTFYQFVLGHGAFELTAIIIFALAGFELGKAVIMPGRRSRAEVLRSQGQAVLPLVVGAGLFLFIAACLEAFWSARNLGPQIKYTVAAGLWVLVYGFIVFGGKRVRA